MLFAKRDLNSQTETSLSKRFTMRFGRYLGGHSAKETDNQDGVIDISSCYSMLGEKCNAKASPAELPQLINRIITAYEKHTGQWLEPEQIALAAIKYDIQNQANILRHHFSSHLSSNSELHCSRKISFLRLALLADALGLNRFSTSQPTPNLSQLPSCRRKLNILLDDISMPEIESNGRELRERCIESLAKKGITPDALQACWHLRMRYTNGHTSLLLKCMPKEMMREVFEAQHKEQFGFAIKGESILIEALEIEVKPDTPCQPGMTSENTYLDLIMAQWEAVPGTHGTWERSQHNSKTTQENLAFLSCPTLKKLVTVYIPTPNDLAMPELIVKNFQKEVDEAAIHN